MNKINQRFPGLLSGLTITLVLAILAGCTTGCVTSNTPVISNGPNGVLVTNFVPQTTLAGVTITPASVYNTLRGGSATGARIALQADTNSLAYLQAVRQVLGNALATTNYDPVALQNAINALPLNSIHNPTAVEAINGGFEAFQLLEPFLQTQVNARNRFINPALQGIYDGIGDALGVSAPFPNLPSSMNAVALPVGLAQDYQRWQKRFSAQEQVEASWSFDGPAYITMLSATSTTTPKYIP